jgi:hypothetical protein
MFHTETVNGLVNSVTDFPEFFQTAARYPTLVTEFHLYSGYVLYRYQTYDTLYSNTYYKALNIAEWEADNFDQLFGFLVNSHNALTASIHRRTYNKLTENQIQQWIDFLKDRALIDNELEIKNIIYTYITQEKNRVPTNLETQNLINTYIK